MTRFTRVSLRAGIILLMIGAAGVAGIQGPAVTLAQALPTPSSPQMMGGMGMMGGPFSPSARPVTMAQAIARLEQWPSAHRMDGLVLDEVEAYAQNYYGQFKERSTGQGAIQVLVDRYAGRDMPEMGPNIVWNTKYGHAMMQEMMDTMGAMGGMMSSMGMPEMMGGGRGSRMMGAPAPKPGNVAPAQISLEAARRAAEQFLSGYLPGAVVGDGDAFYGYYHFDVLRAGHQIGMLSVNDRTGQVWYHTWHGEFLQKREIHH